MTLKKFTTTLLLPFSGRKHVNWERAAEQICYEKQKYKFKHNFAIGTSHIFAFCLT